MTRSAAELLACALRDHPERCFMSEAVIHDDGGARIVIEIAPEVAAGGRVITLTIDDGVPVRDYA